MSKTPNPKIDASHPLAYEIRIVGHLDQQWSDWFEGMTITLEEDGDTLLTGPVTDQAALYGLLKKVRDLGMPLVSVSSSPFQPPVTGWRPQFYSSPIQRNSSISFTKRRQKNEYKHKGPRHER